jgi:choline/glycine/proline betaine transport protein
VQEKPSELVAKGGIWKGLHPAMGLASKGMVAAFVVFTALNVEFANSIYSAVRGWIESALNWYYISALVIMLFVCVYLMFSRFGSIKLGDDDSKPEFSNFSWFAMLFSAGVGIGLLFFGIAEPIFYFDNTQPWGYPNNPFADHALVTDMNVDRAVLAMRVTYFHWGFHGWAVYVMIGLCLAYFGFRKKLPLTLRSIPSSAIGSMAPSATRSICWRSSAPCSVSRRRWGLASARWPPGSTISSASTLVPPRSSF